jgi:hypothetical protein
MLSATLQIEENTKVHVEDNNGKPVVFVNNEIFLVIHDSSKARVLGNALYEAADIRDGLAHLLLDGVEHEQAQG